MISRHVLDRPLKMVGLLNSTQRGRDLLTDDTVFMSSHGQVVDDLDIEFMSHDCCQLSTLKLLQSKLAS